MTDDIEQRLREELQCLLDEHPEMAPVQFRDAGDVVVISVTDGVPQVARAKSPPALQQGIPTLVGLQGQPAYHIYNLLQSLHCLDEEGLQEGTASLLASTALEEINEVRLGEPELPSASELLHSNSGESGGMAHHLKVLQERSQQLLAEFPERETVILRTARGAVEIGVQEGRLNTKPTSRPGRPYTDVQSTPQVRLYLMQQTIQGLQTALYGDSKPLQVVPPGSRNKVEENLLCQLQSIKSEAIGVPIRRSKKMLYVRAHEIIYPPLRVRVADQKLCVDDFSQPAPMEYKETDYRDLSADLKQLLVAFFAYLSSRTSNGSIKH
jgi:hypothetical protein